jgi:hypothetical protein
MAHGNRQQDQGVQSSSGKARTSRQAVRGEMRAGGEAMVVATRCAARASGHQGQEAPHERRQGHQAQGHRDLHPPARDHDEGRRAAAAGVRHRRARPHQPRVTKLLMTSRPTSRPARASRRRSASTRCTSTRCTATWSRPAKPPVFSKPCSTAWRLQGKDLAIKGKIKSALIYPIASSWSPSSWSRSS